MQSGRSTKKVKSKTCF
uniref:Uncharacterized protein n=1 Tax=Rhizophora mucronata TaxID=61149 RepID=A0A2P2Q183_RHIMU